MVLLFEYSERLTEELLLEYPEHCSSIALDYPRMLLDKEHCKMNLQIEL